MTDDDGGRGGRQSANLARHLSNQYPGTVLLLARHAPGGRPDATGAELTGIDDGGLAVAATTPEGRVVLRLALPDGLDEPCRGAAPADARGAAGRRAADVA